RHSDGALAGLLDVLPRSEAWLTIYDRAVELYGTYRGEEERNAALRKAQRLLHAQVREPDYLRRSQILYLEDLERRAAEASDAEEAAYYQGLAAEVRAALAR
ncbi:MAG: hypothetical protein ACUVYA_19455, partial [Planctomycetota bacterium]